MVKIYTLPDVTVTTAGTRVQISATSIRASSVVLTPKSTNTGSIFVGDTSVAAAQGMELVKTSPPVVIQADQSGRSGGDELDLSDIWVDAATSGDKLKVTYQKRRE